MSRLFRCLVILLFVFMSACDLIEDSYRTIMDFVSPDTADTGSPSAYISPYSGPIGTVYSIYFSSFPAGQLVEICSSFLQTGEVLLCWQTEADEMGNGSGGLRSEAGDRGGEYLLTVRNLERGDMVSTRYFIEAEGLARPEFVPTEKSSLPDAPNLEQPPADDPSMDQPLVVNPFQIEPAQPPQLTPTPTREPDRDYDGIPDRIEDWMAQNFMPYYIFDEEEPEPGKMRWIYQITPIFENAKPRWVLFIVTLLADDDYAPVDFPLGEDDIFWHYGDSESMRIFFSWRPVLIPVSRYDGSYSIEHITIRRHFHAYEYSPTDFGYYNDNHPYVFVSEGKHAMYPSSDECEQSDITNLVGFLDSNWLKEDCGGGFQVLPAWQGYNVGEREPHNFNFTSDHFDLKNTYPGEAIWQKNYPFCGGNNLGDKRWAIRKIGIDFGVYKYEQDWGNCAGEVEGKWYYVDGNRELEFWPNTVGESP